MNDVDIVITIPGSIYAALDEERKTKKVPRPDPSNPENTIFGPEFASVEAFVEAVVEENIAPVVRQRPSAEVQAIQAQIAALQQQQAGLMKATKGVARRG